MDLSFTYLKSIIRNIKTILPFSGSTDRGILCFTLSTSEGNRISTRGWTFGLGISTARILAGGSSW